MAKGIWILIIIVGLIAALIILDYRKNGKYIKTDEPVTVASKPTTTIGNSTTQTRKR